MEELESFSVNFKKPTLMLTIARLNLKLCDSEMKMPFSSSQSHNRFNALLEKVLEKLRELKQTFKKPHKAVGYLGFEINDY